MIIFLAYKSDDYLIFNHSLLKQLIGKVSIGNLKKTDNARSNIGCICMFKLTFILTGYPLVYQAYFLCFLQIVSNLYANCNKAAAAEAKKIKQTCHNGTHFPYFCVYCC